MGCNRPSTVNSKSVPLSSDDTSGARSPDEAQRPGRCPDVTFLQRPPASATSTPSEAGPCWNCRATLRPRPGVRQRMEQRLVQQLIAQATVEAFDEAALLRLAGRDIMPGDRVSVGARQHRGQGQLAFRRAYDGVAT